MHQGCKVEEKLHLGIREQKRLKTTGLDCACAKTQSVMILVQYYLYINKQTNTVALVSERTIPTERPPYIGEVHANLCGYRASRGQRNGSPQPYSQFLDKICIYMMLIYVYNIYILYLAGMAQSV
jgi:hypothetical protein